MPYPYQIWLRQPAYDYLETLELSERERVLAWIERFGPRPTRRGEFVERGSDGRDWQGAVVGDHAVVWWVDDAVCEVKVVAIRPADSRGIFSRCARQSRWKKAREPVRGYSIRVVPSRLRVLLPR